MDPFTESLVRDVDQQTLADVLLLFEHDRAREAEELNRDRQAAGQVNHRGMGAVDGLGQVTFQPTTHDFFAARELHGAAEDPNFWRWFSNRPDGEYCRVRYNPRTATITNLWDPNPLPRQRRVRFSKTYPHPTA